MIEMLQQDIEMMEINIHTLDTLFIKMNFTYFCKNPFYHYTNIKRCEIFILCTAYIMSQINCIH